MQMENGVGNKPSKKIIEVFAACKWNSTKKGGGEGEERKLKQPPLCTDCIAGEALSVSRHNSCLLRGSFPGDFPWDSFIHLSLTPSICITRSQRELLV